MSNNNNKPIFAKFLNRNGHEYERQAAEKVFNTIDSYEIIGGSIGGCCSYFVFRGIPGTWNTVMFDTSWEDAAEIMDHDCAVGEDLS